MQESRVCAHLQAPVHISFDMRHLHLNVWHCVVHEHDTTPKQLSGMAGRDISVGTSCPSTNFQPCVVGSGKFGCWQCACHHYSIWCRLTSPDYTAGCSVWWRPQSSATAAAIATATGTTVQLHLYLQVQPVISGMFVQQGRYLMAII